ncbi:Mbov_0392 family ICE element protein [Mycoplasma capricolum]|uniref:Mbov_0392 family ICE element protein n=1 Tax=Mycoplasma capricolum TaxID=2095 RepID=UPI003DA1FA0D
MKTYFKYEDIKAFHSYAFDLNNEELTNLFNKQLEKFAENQSEDDIQLAINYIKDFADESYNVSTEINEKIFKWLISKSWDLYIFEQIEKCYELINEKYSSFEELDEFADENNLFSFTEFCIEEKYVTVEDLLEVIDEDLKQNGLETKYHFDLISDLTKRHESDYVRIKESLNGLWKINQIDKTEIEEAYDDEEIEELYKHYIIKQFVDDLNN